MSEFLNVLADNYIIVAIVCGAIIVLLLAIVFLSRGKKAPTDAVTKESDEQTMKPQQIEENPSVNVETTEEEKTFITPAANVEPVQNEVPVFETESVNEPQVESVTNNESFVIPSVNNEPVVNNNPEVNQDVASNENVAEENNDLETFGL